MEIGIGSYAYRWALGTADFRPAEPLSLAQMIDSAAELGCRVLQIADSNELDSASTAGLAELRAQADAKGIRLQIGLSGAVSGRLLRYLGIAQALNSDLVRLVLHSDTESVDDATAITHLQNVAAAYEAAGVRIGIENHFLSTSPQILAILEAVDSDAVGVVLDVANSIMCSEWPAVTIAALAPHAVCLHLKDYRIVPDSQGVGGHVVGAPLGAGLTDVHAVLDVLGARAPQNFAVIYEQWCPRGASVEDTLEREAAWRESSIELLTAMLEGRAVSPAGGKREHAHI